MTYSDRHPLIAAKCSELAKGVRSMQDYAKALKSNKIPFEDYTLATGRELLIFTGSSGYDIVGLTAKMRGGRIVLDEMCD